MNRKRVSAQLLLYFLMLMFLMVVVGCSSSSSSSDNAVTYSVSGTVTGASGVTVNLSGDATATTTTATDGTYSFTGLLAGNYSVTAVKTGFTFDPLSRGGTLTADKTGVDFAATANAGLTYSISGTVSGAVIAGVTILLTGDANAETVTGTDGKYSFPGVLLNGNYTVTPSLTGYTFSPAGTGVIISGADATGINFTATANTAATYSISGTVSGDTIAGVTITLSGGTSGTAITTTDGSGNYSFSGLLPGGYTVTPSKTGYTFTLASLSPTITSANIPGQNFTSSVVGGTFIYSISGTVSGAVTSGVTINLTGAATATATTGGGGTYSFPNLANGAYTVTPVLAGYTFSPSSRAVNIAGGNITGRDFTATANTAATYSISGTVSGDVKSGVTITLGGAGSGTTTTNGSGNYSFSGLVNGSYTLTPSLAGYTITPSSLSPTISSANVPGQNFVVGSAPTAFSQADLNATWDIQVLQTNGSVSSWSRQTVTINSLGTISFTSCLKAKCLLSRKKVVHTQPATYKARR
ncbi:MAG: carboxypeptidase-like regulatory domain-containing protein [Deltaproteobacteria bacterium]|nr:carboxypeptidase-like regulatory domain-containing protein [Deltaproteobacteria bacterium]